MYNVNVLFFLKLYENKKYSNNNNSYSVYCGTCPIR